MPENERCVRFSPENPGAPGRLHDESCRMLERLRTGSRRMLGAIAHWEPPYANAIVPRKPPRAGIRRGQMPPLRMLNIPPPFVSNL